MPKDFATRTPPAGDGTTDSSSKKSRQLEFGKRVYAKIVELGITQSELARRAGLGRDSISQYIRGRSIPTPVNLGLLAKGLGVKAEDLYPDYEERAYTMEELSQEMRAVPGDPDHMWVKINMKLPVEKAMQIFNIVNEK
jgi:transcriptional regulator with XRE-family HTH domain